MSPAEPPRIGEICGQWWRQEIKADTGAARMARAQLRRADTPLAALAVSATHRLNAALPKGPQGPDWPDRLALIAVALAHVKEGSGAPLARRFGTGDPKALSALRFTALIRSQTPRELLRPLVRALAVVGGTANAARLAEDLYFWSDKTRARWCFEYYGVNDALPPLEESQA